MIFYSKPSFTNMAFLRPRIGVLGRCNCWNEVCEIYMYIRCWQNINWCSSITKAALIFCSQEHACPRSGNILDCPCSKHTSLCWKPAEWYLLSWRIRKIALIIFFNPISKQVNSQNLWIVFLLVLSFTLEDFSVLIPHQCSQHSAQIIMQTPLHIKFY